MHSFHPSRGRILFEVLCALALSASLAGAWQQTGATTMLAASLAAALFGLSHGFGMRRGPVVAAEPQRIDFASDDHEALDTNLHLVEPVANEVTEPAPVPVAVAVEPNEPAAAPAKASRKAKPSRKTTARRSKASQEAVAAEPEAVVPMIFDEDHPRIEPLFEPEPFVRQPRAVVFGRKAG